MAAAGVSPNIDTFNSILHMLVLYKRLTVTRTWSMNVLSEINQSGLGNISVACELQTFTSDCFSQGFLIEYPYHLVYRKLAFDRPGSRSTKLDLGAQKR